MSDQASRCTVSATSRASSTLLQRLSLLALDSDQCHRWGDDVRLSDLVYQACVKAQFRSQPGFPLGQISRHVVVPLSVVPLSDVGLAG